MILKASARDKTGTVSAKQARQSGKIPATIYGKEYEPKSVLISDQELRHVIRSLGRNAVLDVEIDGDLKQKVMIQYISRSPMTSSILNIEFRTIRAGDRVRVTVPIHLHGGDAIQDAEIMQTLLELSLEAPADHIPSDITLDISTLQIGDVLTVADLKVSDDVTVLTEADESVVSVSAPTVFEEPETEAEEGGEEAEVPTVGEEAAEGSEE